MGDDFLNDNDFFMGNDDFLDDQQTTTPPIDSMSVGGTNKLLVVIFVVDCSRTMEGDRIAAVNAALEAVTGRLKEFKKDNGVELKIAIMSFTSSAKWELQLTDIDEVSLVNMKTRPGLTEYGNAFHELNKVLHAERYMKHTGKIASPAILFLTDGGPTDEDNVTELKELLKNRWFAASSRCVILLGDAICDESAKDAVSRFVKNPETDILSAEESVEIVSKIETATRHIVDGEPVNKGNDGTSDQQDVLPDVWSKDQTDIPSVDWSKDQTDIPSVDWPKDQTDIPSVDWPKDQTDIPVDWTDFPNVSGPFGDGGGSDFLE